ncbi:MAG: TrkH family potassium uptake protein [Lentisphaeria bacterium]|nr:TrkH family potassium uptake protein [Lentisphaeria bacterium]
MKRKNHWNEYCLGAVALAAFLFLLAENTDFGDAHPRLFASVNIGVWSLFAADVLLRIFFSDDRKTFVHRHWLEFIVFIPLIQYLPGAGHPSVSTVVRQVVIVVMLVSRIRRSHGLLQLLNLKPARLMLAGFLGAIGAGSVLLTLPAATTAGERLPLIDAVFTATSAVCVTGLIVRDTATYFSPFGQMIIASLIQIGGLGIMTFSVSLTVFLGKRVDISQRAVLQSALDHDTLAGLRGLIRFVVLMTFVLEAIGAVLLFLAWRTSFDSPFSAIYHSVFHSVSAFCNAGFSTFSDSLVGFRDNTGVNVVICGLIIFGGLGFVVMKRLFDGVRRRHPAAGDSRSRLQSRIVLRMTVFLILTGMAIIFLTERSGLLRNLAPGSVVLSSFFQSVTARTAGFNTLDIGALSSATLLALIILMFIGASPGSTAGGIKTTTVACLWAAITASLRNRAHTEIHRRTIPTATVYKALTLLCLSLCVVGLFTLVLLAMEKQPFLDVLFEVVSAFGTVGLSTGLTPELSGGGRILITVLMFIGRLGPLTIAYAMLPSHAKVTYKYAEEQIMIG